MDDEASVLNSIRRALLAADHGFEVMTKQRGYDACVEFGHFEPHLVILDVFMPGMDGRKVLRSMMGSWRAETTRFLVVSGHEEVREEMLDMGCDRFLAKPFSDEELVTSVSELCGLMAEV